MRVFASFRAIGACRLYASGKAFESVDGLGIRKASNLAAERFAKRKTRPKENRATDPKLPETLNPKP